MNRTEMRDEINNVRNLATAVRLMADGMGGPNRHALGEVAAAIEDRLEAVGKALDQEKAR